jgi:hypothetical protein
VLWEYQLPAGGYATPSVYVINGKQYVVIAAGGGGKNMTKSGDSVIAFALPDEQEEPTSSTGTNQSPDSGWIQLFDGKTLNGWVHMNGSHTFDVEDGAIVGRTVEGSVNSFLCSLREFDNFELELETYIDPLTNSGIQIRTKIRPVTEPGSIDIMGAGRVNGPQVEIRLQTVCELYEQMFHSYRLGLWLADPLEKRGPMDHLETAFEIEVFGLESDRIALTAEAVVACTFSVSEAAVRPEGPA